MSDEKFPPDVAKAAIAAYAGHGRAGEFEETVVIRNNIARAIMDERERCARAAEGPCQIRCVFETDEQGEYYANGYADAESTIAILIRKGA